MLGEVSGLETWQRIRNSFGVSMAEAGVDITNQVFYISSRAVSSSLQDHVVSHTYLYESDFYEPESQLSSLPAALSAHKYSPNCRC